MGFFVDGKLTRAAVLAKAGRRLVEVDAATSGWLFHAGDTLGLIAKHAQRPEAEVETDGDTAVVRKKGKTVNS